MAQDLYYEDFYIGQKFQSAASYKVTAEEIKAFARDYDPQPFHTDEAAAKATFFGGLAASGWHTAAMTMRLLTEVGPQVAGGLIGAWALKRVNERMLRIGVVILGVALTIGLFVRTP